jgi:protein-L-isoaspartate(D-aspartate) O-methyltransferase
MENLSTLRMRYAELIRKKAGLRSERLARALREVRREDYLGPGPWKIMRFSFPLKYEDTADADPVHVYDDVLVALDPSRQLNNGLPSRLCSWIDALDLNEGDHVVHAGCGTGYYTALMAHVVGERGRVIAIEFDPQLAERARTNLQQFPQVDVITGDASKLDPGPTDAMFVNAGAAHPCPLWLDSVKLSGRLVFPMIRWQTGNVMGVGGAGWGVMMHLEHLAAGWKARQLGPVGIFPCFGATDSEADRRLGEALSKNGLTDVRSLRREPHRMEDSCLLHGEGYCFSSRDCVKQ